MAPPRIVLLTRPRADAEATAARLAALGWMPLRAPMLRIRMLPAEIPEDVAAIALTSGNAIPALPARLHAVPVFAVGDATASRARAAGFARVRSAGADAAALAALIAAEAPPGRLLLAVGEGRGDRLARALADPASGQARIVDRRAVYAADPTEALPMDAVDALRAGRVAAALFFSAETARVFVRLAEAAGVAGCCAGLAAFAIGAPAVVALQALPWREIGQASHPTQEAILALLPMIDPRPATEAPSTPEAAPGEETPPAPRAAPGADAAWDPPRTEAPPPSPPPTSAPAAGAAGTGAARHRPGPWLIGAGFLLLAAGLAYLWQRPQPSPGAGSAELAALRGQVAALRGRLERHPAAPGGPHAAHLAAQQAATARALDALSARTTALAAQVAGLAAQVPPLGQHLAAADDRVHALALSQAGANNATLAALAALRQELAGQAAAQTALAGRLAALAARSGATARLAAVQVARAALAAGRPLGPLPDAPPALARFAATAPPTEARLRLAFPAAARAALAASEPATQGRGFWGALLARAEALVTVRQGTHVILGTPASGPLGAAGARLRAGDLAGAVAALGGLDGKAAAAMAPWRTQAEDVLAARAALDAMSAAPARSHGG